MPPKKKVTTKEENGPTIEELNRRVEQLTIENAAIKYSFNVERILNELQNTSIDRTDYIIGVTVSTLHATLEQFRKEKTENGEQKKNDGLNHRAERLQNDDELNKKIENLEAKLETLTREVKRKDEEIEILSCSSVSSGYLRISGNEISPTALSSHKSSDDKYVKSLEEENAQLTKDLHAEKSKLAKYVAVMESEKSTLEEAIAKLQDENKKQKQSYETLKEQKENEKSTLEEAIAKLQDENKKQKQSYETLKEQKEKEKGDLLAEKQKKDAEIKALQEENRALKQREEKPKNMNEKLKKLEQEKDNLNKQLTALEKENDEVKFRLKESQIISANDNKAVLQLKIENERLRTRLSDLAGAQMTLKNPNIADLSDAFRPTKLSEEYSQLYDNLWTDAFEEHHGKKEEDIIQMLRKTLLGSYAFCESVCRDFTVQLTNSSLALPNSKPKFGVVPVVYKKQLQDMKKSFGVFLKNDVKESYRKQNTLEGGYKTKNYIDACVELCWLMVIQEPPVFIETPATKDSPFDSDTYRTYTKTGKKVDFVVWPALRLHQGGPLLARGVAQGKN